ncbi:MAG: hypothetical protein LKJ72_03350 [[Lactobacillus] timonensis]|jgi:hypothetical protein|uniref:hypothetical protein n=1 Tax=[Lactobacillus] timonensis TaxID=1970790 RepID=UPI0023526EFB|nr:hypothetical protein [[Lactobacillus] timonensis]MCI1926038.1 hypothetical protein [[Lactobacillus] timonensis]MCI1957352.1 hypothetical protein [[Lactobacillus] timonensis]MCI1970450.1 hypothetical protein [[Lactobacillus] timonensis]MCI2006592.1 hypothetical protein [[Lactobacillus] timonensis]
MFLVLTGSKTLTYAQQIDKLYSEINRQDTWFATVFTAVIAIMAIIVAIFTAMQWHLSKTQLTELKNDTIAKVDDKYQERVENLETSLQESKKYQNDMAMLLANSLNDKFFVLEQNKDTLKQSVYSNEIQLILESIVQNNNLEEITKISAMSFVRVNISNAKRIGNGHIVKQIEDSIMNNDLMKKYYLASEKLFEKLESTKPDNK